MKKTIGSVKINNFTVLAPIAGVTNLPFRLVAKSSGCGLVYSEMISANALTQKSLKSLNLLKSVKEEKPLSVQIFGSNPHLMSEAAQIVEFLNADILDINLGCSVKKILKSGSGSALMKNPKKTEIILKEIRKKINIPITIKIRSGWDPSGKEAINISKIAEDCGVDGIAIHPRTASQGFKGRANWKIIKMIKKSVKIPIIGNGDIKNYEDALKMKNETKCDYVMIGRSSIENPMIFKQINELIQGKIPQKITIEKKLQIMNTYLKNSIKYLNKKSVFFVLRRQLPFLIKQTKAYSNFRFSNNFISSEKEVLSLLSIYKNFTLNKN